ncbi:MAG: tRNA-dihydrouridine synthase [Phycisphaerales bacterium]|nr:tRNA-dihydrouridine synthase [Phycisphaerales bacterium]
MATRDIATLKLGHVPLETPLLLAPIAGYCDLAFRTICREYGGVGLACTDLLSPMGLLRGTATSLDLARTNEVDKPIGMQLYGSDPEIMAQGARWAVEHGATIVDINMGCPVDKVTKKDGGSALLTNLDRAVKIAERVVRELEKCPLDTHEWGRRIGQVVTDRHSALGKRHPDSTPSGRFQSSHAEPRMSPACSSSSSSSRIPSATCLVPTSPVPLTCKMRLCWSDADYHGGRACSPLLARMLADVGVIGVTVHGRTTEMKFSGVVQLAGIARVVEEVDGRIPIIGNGDVRDPEDAIRMMRETGCGGVMIGRGALSAPWLFRDAWASMRGEEIPATPDDAEKTTMMRRYFELMRAYRGDHYAMTQIRRRIAWFAKRMIRKDPVTGRIVGVKPLKEAIRVAAGPTDIHMAFDRFAAGELIQIAEVDEAEPDSA